MSNPHPVGTKCPLCRTIREAFFNQPGNVIHSSQKEADEVYASDLELDRLAEEFEEGERLKVKRNDRDYCQGCGGAWTIVREYPGGCDKWCVNCSVSWKGAPPVEKKEEDQSREPYMIQDEGR